MAENLTIARPYAQATFDLALKDNSFDKWQNMLYAMNVACLDKDFIKNIKSCSSSKQASEIFINILDDLVDDHGKNFILILGENNRFDVIPEIYEEFVRLRDLYEKVLDACVISAREIGTNELNSLQEQLASKYNCKVKLTNKIDKSIIGGVILKIGDEVIDASVKTSLINLSSILK